MSRIDWRTIPCFSRFRKITVGRLCYRLSPKEGERCWCDDCAIFKKEIPAPGLGCCCHPPNFCPRYSAIRSGDCLGE